MKRLSVLSAAFLLASLFVAAPVEARGSGSQYAAGRYIVTFADEPLASYTGYRKGYAATRPAAGKHLNPNATSVKRWQTYLRRLPRKQSAEQALRYLGLRPRTSD